LLPIGGEAVATWIERIRSYWERFALQREQAPSPQVRRSILGIEVIQHAIHRQFRQHDDLCDRQRRVALAAFQKVAKSLVITLAEASDSQACANSVSLLMSGAMKNIGLGQRGGLGVGLNMAITPRVVELARFAARRKIGWQLYAG
jgi:hypothetical protein